MSGPSVDVAPLRACLRGLLPDCAMLACGTITDQTARLFPSERPAVARAIAKRRHEYATGRVLARAALAQLGVPWSALVPDARRRPLWPAGVTGSITHSTGLCAVAVARGQDVPALGIDIERIADIPADILATISPPEEIDALSGVLPDDILRAVLFSAREAVFKAYNPQTDHFLGHRDVVVSLSGDRFRARIVSPQSPAFMGSDHIDGRFACVDGMVATVVARRVAKD